MNILQDIYSGGYCPCETAEKIPPGVKDRKWAFFDEIEKRYGVEVIERHWDDLCEADSARDYANFREGFRLGVSLMMELL